MKIIPDRAYARMQCGASRLTNGSGRVLPFISSKIPFDKVAEKWRRFVMPGIILAPIVAGFIEPRTMGPIVLVWVIAAWKLGTCPHCARAARRTKDEELAAQDSGEQ